MDGSLSGVDALTFYWGIFVEIQLYKTSLYAKTTGFIQGCINKNMWMKGIQTYSFSNESSNNRSSAVNLQETKSQQRKQDPQRLYAMLHEALNIMDDDIV